MRKWCVNGKIELLSRSARDHCDGAEPNHGTKIVVGEGGSHLALRASGNNSLTRSEMSSAEFAVQPFCGANTLTIQEALPSSNCLLLGANGFELQEATLLTKLVLLLGASQSNLGWRAQPSRPLRSARLRRVEQVKYARLQYRL
jgi:hypothetical protein